MSRRSASVLSHLRMASIEVLNDGIFGIARFLRSLYPTSVAPLRIRMALSRSSAKQVTAAWVLLVYQESKAS